VQRVMRKRSGQYQGEAKQKVYLVGGADREAGGQMGGVKKRQTKNRFLEARYRKRWKRSHANRDINPRAHLKARKTGAPTEYRLTNRGKTGSVH